MPVFHILSIPVTVAFCDPNGNLTAATPAPSPSSRTVQKMWLLLFIPLSMALSTYPTSTPRWRGVVVLAAGAPGHKGNAGGGGVRSAREISNDREMEKARKTLEQTRLRKEAKTARKVEQATTREKQLAAKSVAGPIKEGANFAQQTVWGANIIQCRPFPLDGQKKFDFLGGYTSLRALPTYAVPEIAFLGRSNVGKSSLLNALTGLNKKVAVESKTPGRTQCINVFACGDRDGPICNFADLPGYGYAKISKALQDEISVFLRDYLEHRGALRCAVLLVDVRREPQGLDAGMITFLKDAQVPFVLVATKVDKLKRDEVTRSLAALRTAFALDTDYPLVPFSAVTGEGTRELWRVLRDVLVGDSAVVQDTDEEYAGDDDDGDDGDDNGDGVGDRGGDGSGGDLDEYMD